MLIVLPGALPDPAHARPLAAELARLAPTLAGWLAAGRAHTTQTDPERDGCTAYERWQLKRRGFKPDANQTLATGLGPLHALAADAGPYPDDPIWLARLSHVAWSTDGAALLPIGPTALSSAESVALFQTARESLEPAGFQLQADVPNQWRVRPPDGFALAAVSPALAAQGHLQSWWPQEPAARPWRRVLTEIQMSWHDHPVNQARAARGLPAVNHLWLYGGARAAQLSLTPPPAAVHDTLLQPAEANDWAGWLAALSALQADQFAHWQGPAPELLLTGVDRYVHVVPRARRFWTIWQQPADWRAWWSPPI